MRKIAHCSPGPSTGPFISASSGEMGNLADTPASFCKVSRKQGTEVIPGYKTGKHVGPGAQLCRMYTVIGAPSSGETGDNRREYARSLRFKTIRSINERKGTDRKGAGPSEDR